jgi:hypothetical protein
MICQIIDTHVIGRTRVFPGTIPCKELAELFDRWFVSLEILPVQWQQALFTVSERYPSDAGVVRHKVLELPMQYIMIKWHRHKSVELAAASTSCD